MSDNTPKTNSVREEYAKQLGSMGFYPNTHKFEEFDRWLEQHDAEIAQKAIDRFYELLILKGEYQDIYGLAYVGDAVKKELCGEIQIVIKDAQILEAPIFKGEQK